MQRNVIIADIMLRPTEAEKMVSEMIFNANDVNIEVVICKISSHPDQSHSHP